jgi:hypothetical protein
MWQRRSPPQSGGEVQSQRTSGSARAHLSQEARSGAVEHVAAPEPTSAERRGLEAEDTRQRRSPPQPGGEVWSRGTCGSVEAHLSQDVRSGAVGHMAVRGCTPCYLS